MRRIAILLATAGVWISCISLGLGQSLGDVARGEQERRSTARDGSVRSFTNKDLDKLFPESRPVTGGARTQAADSSQPAADSGQDASPALPDEPDWGALERVWRQRFDAARQKILGARSRAWRDTVRTEFYAGLPVQVRVREAVETEELRVAIAEIEELREELRRAGMPPGWGRE